MCNHQMSTFTPPPPPTHTHTHTNDPVKFKSLMNTMESYDRNATNQRFLKYKPLSPLREDRRSWWVYVITAVLEEDVKRRTRMWSWKHIKQHRWGWVIGHDDHVTRRVVGHVMVM